MMLGGAGLALTPVAWGLKLYLDYRTTTAQFAPSAETFQGVRQDDFRDLVEQVGDLRERSARMEGQVEGVREELVQSREHTDRAMAQLTDRLLQRLGGRR